MPETDAAKFSVSLSSTVPLSGVTLKERKAFAFRSHLRLQNPNNVCRSNDLHLAVRCNAAGRSRASEASRSAKRPEVKRFLALNAEVRIEPGALTFNPATPIIRPWPDRMQFAE